MGEWRYVGWYHWHNNGLNGNCYAWTNGTDYAILNCNQADPREIDNFPHPNADIYYGAIEQNYYGDIIAWCNDLGINRETLDQLHNS